MKYQVLNVLEETMLTKGGGDLHCLPLWDYV
jgi:hypothetical protein